MTGDEVDIVDMIRCLTREWYAKAADLECLRITIEYLKVRQAKREASRALSPDADGGK